MMKIKKPTKDTIALILGYLATIIAVTINGDYDWTGVLIGILGVVLVGEYFAVKNTGYTISDITKFTPKRKRIIVVAIWIMASILTWHFW